MGCRWRLWTAVSWRAAKRTLISFSRHLRQWRPISRLSFVQIRKRSVKAGMLAKHVSTIHYNIVQSWRIMLPGILLKAGDCISKQISLYRLAQKLMRIKQKRQSRHMRRLQRFVCACAFWPKRWTCPLIWRAGLDCHGNGIVNGGKRRGPPRCRAHGH